MKYNLETGSHTVYALQYHFVTVTKYRADLPPTKSQNGSVRLPATSPRRTSA